MNPVEIEEAVSDLVGQRFDVDEFPFQFLMAFGAKDTTIKRLRKGESNASDVAGGVLQRNNIHIAVAPPGEVGTSLAALRSSPKTAAAKAKFILATDGESVEAEDLVSGEVLACPYLELPTHFATFLPLAGISVVKEIKNNPIDVKATGRLNRLYVELLKDNPDWATEARRRELNQFMARLIFCFFAEDTGIFREGSFTATIAQMSHAGHGSGEERWGNTHEVLQHLFLAMDTPVKHEGNFDDRYRRAAGIRPWADVFPYVNGSMFTDATACPRFSRPARAYLLRTGELDWKEINPDIFGSMIQAVADEGERGELGMHYTSVPNILKVLNPLFLDDLREQLEAAADSKPKLRNLRKRLANIRVFDPACGSGNFLVIAYKEMRAIEAEIVERLGGEANLKLQERRSVIPLSNLFGIEIKDFAAEIARLSLLIAEYQADCIYLSQHEARTMVLPLHRTGQVTVGNALLLDWLEVCPPRIRPTATEYDLAGPTGRMALEGDGLGEGTAGETYICGNPPYRGSQWQTDDQKADLRAVFAGEAASPASLDYVSGWFMAARRYLSQARGSFAFVTTNSINQGRQVEGLWPFILTGGVAITFAHRNIKWANLASDKAGVTVNIIGVSNLPGHERQLFDDGIRQAVPSISPYLVAGDVLIVAGRSTPLSELPRMSFGNMPNDGGALLLDVDEARWAVLEHEVPQGFVRRFLGSQELVQGQERRCIWVTEPALREAERNPWLVGRFRCTRESRAASARATTKALAGVPWRFGEVRQSGAEHSIVIPRVSSENRDYLPVGLAGSGTIIGDRNFALYDAPLWNLSLIASRAHWVWIGTVCARMRTDFSYSNTLGWNTFPVPKLTEQNKTDLTRTAENILLAREAHFPATIADLYDPEKLPDDLRRAHDENDEVLERIYIGRRFRNDTERLEKLFDLYTRMTADHPVKREKRKISRGVHSL